MNATLRYQTRAYKTSDGFILVAVLWILSALVALVSIYAIYVSNTAMALSVSDEAVMAEGLISAGVELAVYKMIAAPKGAIPTQGQVVFRMGKAGVTADYRAETARIDLNYAPKELLAGLFVALGEQPAQAKQYVERIDGWRTPPKSEADDSEASLYRDAGLGYAPRGAAFAHVAELCLVLGLPPALVERALPHLTVFSGRAEINPAIAAREVVAALPDKQTATPGTTTEAGDSVRITILIEFDNGRRRAAEVVVLMRGAGAEPYRVLSWVDDIEIPPAGQRQRAGLRH
jgi:general secretion pathway protein K